MTITRRRWTERIRRLLKGDFIFHMQRRPVSAPSELIDVVDKFLDDKLDYDFQWDDFISWRNQNSSLEKFRNQIGEYERYLFSDSIKDRIIYCNRLIDLRNDLAAIVGLPSRPHLSRLGSTKS
jgi:hypothetical protein